MITVLVVDDHAVMRNTLQDLIAKSDDIQVVATASNGREAVAQVTSACPDVIVMDISMPEMDGIEATRRIIVHCSLTGVLMLSTYDNPDYVRRALDAGAIGYVLKDTLHMDLLDGIRALSTGKNYFSHRIMGIAERILLERK